MTDKLPPNLLKLFAPRPPLPYMPPLDKDPEKRIGCKVGGIASLLSDLKNYDPEYVPWKSIEEKRKEKVVFFFSLLKKKKENRDDMFTHCILYRPKQKEKKQTKN
jgi:U1 small nuclear ribonucleoprotein